MTINERGRENIAAESDVRIALDVVQKQLQPEKQNEGTGTNVDKTLLLIKRQFLSDCTNHLVDAIRQSVHTIPDEEFHKRVYDAKQSQIEQPATTVSQNRYFENADFSDDDDCSCTSEIDDEELVDMVAIEQVQKLREQLRLQAQINNKKRSTYLATTSKIIEIEQMIFLAQNAQVQQDPLEDSCDDNDSCVNNNTLDQNHVMLHELQNRLASLKESLSACDEETIIAASDRITETMQEVQRNFTVHGQAVDAVDGQIANNKFSVLLTQPLSQVEVAIAKREDDDDLNFERAKNKIISASIKYAEPTFKTSNRDELISRSPQKAFLEMIM
jgi:hypothetical protein